MRQAGHNYRYAVEQIALSLFQTIDIDCVSELRGDVAVTAIAMNGTVGTAEESVPDIADPRSVQYALKISFYRAALPFLDEVPLWGAVSGVKPTQLALKGADLERDYFVSRERAELCRSAADFARDAIASLEPRDVMLYAGIPFCPTRCAYCSFVSSSVEKSLKLVEPYLEALFLEILQVSETIKQRGERVRAVYIGGGTPTTLSAEQLERLISKLRESFGFSSGGEFTVEAGRPDTITREKLRVLKDCGVTRVSVNPQTMNAEILVNIGRRHTPDETLRAFEIVRETGFECVNMDFIAGLPGESPDSFRRSIDIGLGLRPENFTVHTLTRKRGSDLSAVRSAELFAVMPDSAYEKLRAAGYAPYYLYRQKYSAGENTGWTLPGGECLYNICMMEELCSVYSLGAGGSTKLVGGDGARRVMRKFNPKYPHEYIEKYKQT